MSPQVSSNLFNSRALPSNPTILLYRANSLQTSAANSSSTNHRATQLNNHSRCLLSQIKMCNSKATRTSTSKTCSSNRTSLLWNLKLSNCNTVKFTTILSLLNNNKTSSKLNLFNNHNHSCLCKCQCPKIILDSKISKLTLQLDCQMNKHNPTHCLPFNSNRMQTKWLLVFRMWLNFNRCRMKIQRSQHSRTIPKWLSTTERKVTMFLQSNTTWRWRKSTQKMALHGRRLVTVTCFRTT